MMCVAETLVVKGDKAPRELPHLKVIHPGQWFIDLGRKDLDRSIFSVFANKAMMIVFDQGNDLDSFHNLSFAYWSIFKKELM